MSLTHEFEPLTQLLTDDRLALADMIRHALHIGDALRRIHADGRCHGALSPDLIQVSASTARLLPAPHDALEIWGPYSAPEVLRGEAVDTRTDIFAFGAVLYEMATGSCAFPARGADELSDQILKKGIAPIGHAGLDEVVNHCLAKDPAARWQKMQKVQMELKLVAIAEQQRETSGMAYFETTVREELANQARTIGELERALTAQTNEVTKAVTAALSEVQVQFGEVETFLAASQQRSDQFAQAAAQAVETTLRELETLKVGLANEVNDLALASKSQAATIESMKVSMARSDDFVERVVDALDGLQSAIFKPIPVQEATPVAMAS